MSRVEPSWLCLEVILLSLGLADRINDLKKQNELAQTQVLANQRLALENLEKAESLIDGVAGNQTGKTKEKLSLICQNAKNYNSRHWYWSS